MALFATKEDQTKSLPLNRYTIFDLQKLHFPAALVLASVSPTLHCQDLNNAGKDDNNGWKVLDVCYGISAVFFFL